MDFSVSPFIAYILAYSGIVGVIWFLFSKAEDTLKPKVKKDISNWLKNIDPVEPVKNWPSQFAAVFDRIFGEKHLTYRCFVKSCAISGASVIILLLIQYIWGTGFHSISSGIHFKFLHFVWITALITNLIPDYLSLFETRYILKKVRDNNIMVFVYLFTDFMITFLIAAIMIGLSNIMLRAMYSTFISAVINQPTSLTDVVKSSFENYLNLNSYDVIKYHLTVSREAITFNNWTGCLFYSTFFTSIWLWIYALSGFTVKLAQKLNIGLTWFKGKFDIDKKPLRSMALVSIMIVTIIFVVVPFLR